MEIAMFSTHKKLWAAFSIFVVMGSANLALALSEESEPTPLLNHPTILTCALDGETPSADNTTCEKTTT